MPQSLPEPAGALPPRRRSAVTPPPLRYSVAGPGGDGLSPHLNRRGAFIGRDTPLLAADPAFPGAFRARPQADLELLLSLGYARRVDLTARMPLLKAAAAALSKGDLVRAALSLAAARLPAFLDESHANCVALAENLLNLAGHFGAGIAKANFNRDEPRVPKGNWDGGQWTAEGGGIESVSYKPGGGKRRSRSSLPPKKLHHPRRSQGKEGRRPDRVPHGGTVNLKDRKLAEVADWAHISLNEGGQILQGYWPGANSGATIATGFDLGQYKEKDLENMGFSPSLIAKLSPYLNKRGSEIPEDYRNLRLTKQEADFIDGESFKRIYTSLKRNYNNYIAELSFYDGKNRTEFDDLPKDIRTAILDVAFQKGANFIKGSRSRHAREFGGQVGDQNWSGAATVLREWAQNVPKGFGGDIKRRSEEAMLIDRGHKYMQAAGRKTDK